ncbi:non-ribosomal peptide synthetase [Paenibacillus puerhi]|uniref:non-ribosomal peptide synthetase n=1 Tax=Paenibacillus puerhi TaxID=2692622 RepID=UPI00135C074F|nr:non-ribosomal peptide synthetase [Paenibacillus puerhi]
MHSMFEKEMAYWQGKFDSEDQLTGLAYSRVPTGAGVSDSFAVVTGSLPQELSNRIAAITGGSPLTVFMVLLAGVKGLLHAYTREERLIVGTPTVPSPGGAAPGMNPLLLVKSHIEESCTFRSLLNELKSSLSEALAHQQTPFWNYTEALPIPRLPSGVPVIPTVAALKQLHSLDYQERAKPELAFHFDWDAEPRSLSLEVVYQESRYDLVFISQLIGHLQSFLSVALFQPERLLTDIEVLSEQEKRKLLCEFNPPQTDYPSEQTVHGLFEQQASLHPHAPAVTYGDQSLTYIELNERADALAQRLLEEGAGQEQLIGIMADRSLEMIAGLLGILKAGAAFVPIDPDYPEDRIQFIQEDSGMKLLLTSALYRGRAAAIVGDQVTILDLEHAPWRAQEVSGDMGKQAVSAGPDNLAYVMYTSGSTGKPKGVMVEHRNIIRLVKSTNYVELGEQTRILQTGAIVFDATTFEIWGALLNGGQLVLTDAEVLLNGPRLKEAIERYDITTMWLTAPLFNQLLQQESRLFSALDTLIVGGDALSVPHINMALRHNPSLRIVNGYGPTENTTFSTTYRIEGEQAGAVPIGRPIAHSTAYVVDRQQKLVPVGAWGELLVGGDGVARGYLNRPELTEKMFIEHPFEPGKRCYRTGDFVKWRPDGTLEFKGRIDEQVKIRGFRIEPKEVEAELLKADSVREAVVIVREDEGGQKYLCAYYSSDGELSPGKLRQTMQQTLPAFMIPSFFVQLERLPLTPNGKVDRRALPAPNAAGEAGETYAAPRTELEAELQSIWEDILKLPRVGIRDHFFEIGGHSLRATALVSAVHQKLNKAIRLKDVFQYPTIESMAQAIGDREHTEYTAIPATDVRESYAVSPAQKRMFMVSQLAGAEVSYNMPGAVVLEGEMDFERLEQAFSLLIARHETLRTSFETADGEPIQRVHPEAGFSVECLQALEADIPAVFSRFVRPFDLSQAPLMRAMLIRVAPERHILLTDMHHIISDGASVQVLVQEIMRLYQGEDLQPLPIQYKDYSAWQQKRGQTDRYRLQEEEWLRTFAGEIPVLDLPTDFPRPAVKSFQGRTCEFLLDPEQSAGLQRIAAQTGSTLYMVLLAAYSSLLYKYSGQEDLIVGTPVAGREHPDLQGLIGMFVNTLAIRTNPNGSAPFLDYVQQVKSRTLQAFEQQDYPLEELIGKLGLHRDLSRNPLFDAAFVLHNEEAEPVLGESSGLKASTYPTEHTVAKFDLTLFATVGEHGIACSFEYATSLFKPETVERMGEHFRQLIRSIVDRPLIKLAALEFLTPKERELILTRFNNTAADFPQDSTIHELIEEQAARTPERTAVVFGNERLTYRELNERANRLARTLRQDGVRPDQLVGIMAERSVELIVAMLGVLKAGGAYMPIDPEYPDERIHYMLEDSGAQRLLLQKRLQHKLHAEVRTFFLGDEQSYHPDATNLEAAAGSGDLAYVIYTSGTTGKPKGVMVEHRGLCNLRSYFERELKVNAEDKVAQFASFSFDAATWEIVMALFTGAALVIPSLQTIHNYRLFEQFIRENGVTVATLPPTYALYLEPEQVPGLAKLITAGSAPTKELIQRWRTSVTYINAYGPTEDSICSSAWIYDDAEEQEQELEQDAAPVTIGRPIYNHRMYIVGEDHSLLPVGVAGELCLAGIGLARGYLNRPELTAETFVTSPVEPGERMYRTGDLARWLPDGRIEYLGRADHQVKIRGYRIEPAEVEAQLMKADAMQEAIVIAREDEQGQKQLVAYFIAERVLPASELRAGMERELPGYMIPSFFVQLEKMPLTPNGKIDRQALPAPEAGQSGAAYVPPRTEVEQQLATIWQQVLGAGTVGITDNFFDLGGDSIKSIQVSSRMLQAGYRVEMKDLFQHPTIAALSPHIQAAVRTADQGTVSGAVPLTPVLRWYFEQDQAQPHYFNQSVMLYREEGFEEGALRQAMQAIAEHHDALRLVFRSTEAGYTAWNRGIGEGELFTLETYRMSDVENKAQAIELKCEELQGSMNLEQGPLVKLGLFRMDDGDHLMITIHHAAIDGVSWRILFEDLATAYEQAVTGQRIQLPLKTDSYRKWAEQLIRYANSEQLEKERAYWQSVASVSLKPLPKDRAQGGNLLRDSDTVTAHWSQEDTARLLKQAHRAYSTEVNDLLLTALGMALEAWAGMSAVQINMEGHGREQLLPNLDVTRTIGWFTSQYPVVLDLGREQSIAGRIKRVKERLRQIPNKGIGYGLLRYLSGEQGDPSLAAKPHISFNYLGQFDQDLQSNAIQPSIYSYGMPLSEETKRICDLEVNGMISGGELGLTIGYNRYEYDRDTIERLAEMLEKSLSEVIAHCVAQEQTQVTPSDLTIKGLSMDDLEELQKQANDIGVLADVYTLTPMQQGMLFHARFDPQSPAYFEQVSYELHGRFDPTIFQESLSGLVRRHEALRSNFCFGPGDRPLQIVFQSRTGGFLYEDVRGLEGGERQAYVDTFQTEDKKRGFDLSRDPLLRVSVLRIADDAYRMIWSFHHIIMDGWCLPLLNSEVFEHYYALKENREPRLQEVTPYSEYIKWLEMQSKEEAVRYWSEYLEGYDQQTRLPSVANATVRLAGEADEHQPVEPLRAVLGREQTAKLNRIAREQQVTINTLVQTAWGLLLQGYNNAQDVVFGSVVSGRPAHIPGVENMIGLFINTIPVRIRSDKDASFAETMRRTQAQAVASQAYDYYPLFEVQALTEQKQDLINHILVFENFPVEQQVEQLGGEDESAFSITHVDISEQTNYDFSLSVTPGEEMGFSFEYHSRSFELEDIERIQGHLFHMLEQIADNPNILVGELELATPQERKLLLEDFSSLNWEPAPELTFHQEFERNAELYPDQTAVVYKDQRLSYRELNEKANQLAAKLRGYGVGRESLVCILADRCAELIVSVLAVWKAGGAYVPVDPGYPAERIQLMLEDSGAEVLLTQSWLTPLLSGRTGMELAEVTVLELDDERLYAGTSPDNPPFINEPQDLAYVIYTSGTTGRPKGVMIEHRSLMNTALASRRECRFTEFPVRVLQLASFSFDVFVLDLARSLLHGGMLVICPAEDRIDPELLYGWIRDYDITVLESTPALLLPLMSHIDSHELKVPSMKLLVTGSDSIGVTDYKWLLERFGSQMRVMNGYGVTEAAIDSSFYDEPVRLLSAAGHVPIGKPRINNRFYILNDHFRPVPVGVVGELYIGGAGVARGYRNQPELTAQKFIPNPFVPGERLYRTGDLARWMKDGNVDFLGRSDFQVKIRGFRVELGEIETAMLHYSGIRQAVVVERKDERGQSYLCGYAAGEAIEAEALLAYLRQALPAHMVPARLVVLDRLPLTPNGKVDRKALPEPTSRLEAEAGFQAPRNDAEEQLVRIWEEVLGQSGIGVTDHFFHIGGHSLKVLELVRKLEKQLGRDLPLRLIYDAPTIEELARKLYADNGSGSGQPESSSITKLNEHGSLRMFCFPPMLGYGLGFAGLAEQLEHQAIVYGLDFIEDYESEDDLIEQYMKLITGIQPQGPYVFLGYSMGGNLAFQLTKAMERKGYQVSDVIMVDSLKAVKSTAVSREKIRKQIDRSLDESPNGYNEMLSGKYREKIYAYAQFGNELVNKGVIQANIHALFSPEADASKAASDKQKSWSESTTGYYNRGKLIGSHDELLDAQHIQENAAKIKQIVQQIIGGTDEAKAEVAASNRD